MDTDDDNSDDSSDSESSTEPWFCDACKSGVTPVCVWLIPKHTACSINVVL